MKILEVVKLYSPWVGGIEKTTQDISEEMTKRGHEVTVLCCQPRGKGYREYINNVCVIKSSSFGIFRGMPLSISFIYSFIKIYKEYDIIAIHEPFPLADIAVWLSKTSNNIIVHYHSDIIRQRFLVKIVEPFLRLVLRKSKSVIASSDNLINNSSILRDFKNKISIIPFGTNANKIARIIDKNKVQINKLKYGNYILFVGRLSYYKGTEFLLMAMKEVRSTLVIVGKGEEKENLINIINNEGIKDRVIIIDNVAENELYNLMAGAKVLVLPSIYPSETFGLVLIEAMTVGTPIISTDVGTGTSWINQNGKTGFVVKPREPDQLAKAINIIINDNEVYEDFSKNARKRSKYFDQKIVMDKILLQYKKTISQI